MGNSDGDYLTEIVRSGTAIGLYIGIANKRYDSSRAATYERQPVPRMLRWPLVQTPDRPQQM